MNRPFGADPKSVELRSTREHVQGVMADFGSFRRAMLSALAVLRERDRGRQHRLIVEDLYELLDVDVVRTYEPDGSGGMRLAEISGPELPGIATDLEVALLAAAIAAGKSLVSTHTGLASDVHPLADRCRTEGIATHVLLARANERTYGAFAVHWIGRDRPAYERRRVFDYYWDAIRTALATAHERDALETELAQVRERAYTDQLTRLPNRYALEEQFISHEQTDPLSVLAIDFDGMREANTAFGSYAEGGDVLIKAVAAALGTLTAQTEFACRMHTAGDEFAVLLPGADDRQAGCRAREIESALDALEVPATHRHVYSGASVGSATRRVNESASAMLERAVEAMRTRKAQRKTRHPAGA